MTELEFWAAVRQLGLRPSSNVPTIYLDMAGNTYHIQDPRPMPSEVRAAFIRRLQELMGVRPAPN
jgi:hypothetical protein